MEETKASSDTLWGNVPSYFCHSVFDTNLQLLHGPLVRVAAAALVEAILAVALPVAQRLLPHAARAQTRNLPAGGVALSA